MGESHIAGSLSGQAHTPFHGAENKPYDNTHIYIIPAEGGLGLEDARLSAVLSEVFKDLG